MNGAEKVKETYMPTPGLSLVGFIQNQQQAVNHLRYACVPNPPSKSDVDLITEWQAAKARLGKPTPSAGMPNMTPIPLNEPHISQLLQQPWASVIHALLSQGATFQMIEIAPLLAFQFSVDTTRSAYHCGRASSPPTQQELFDICLPTILSTDQFHASQQGQSVVIKSRSLNLIMAAEGPLPGIPNFIGIQYAWINPLVHVVRYNGRCYLHSGPV